jgi:hypothetical protein
MKCTSSLGFLPAIAGRIFSRGDYLFLQNTQKIVPAYQQNILLWEHPKYGKWILEEHAVSIFLYAAEVSCQFQNKLTNIPKFRMTIMSLKSPWKWYLRSVESHRLSLSLSYSLSLYSLLRQTLWPHNPRENMKCPSGKYIPCLRYKNVGIINRKNISFDITVI